MSEMNVPSRDRRLGLLRWSLGIGLVLLCSAQALPLDPAKSINQYILNNWSSENGLPQNTINAIAQTDDGYLWFGTQEGLVRFNGNTFKLFDTYNTSQLVKSSISTLFKSSDGSLWIGTEGGGVTRLKDDRFTAYLSPNALPSKMITAFAEDHEGSLWIGSEEQDLYIYKNNHFNPLDHPEGLSLKNVKGMVCDRDGVMWVSTFNGLMKYSQNRFTTYTTADGLTSNRVNSLFMDPRGSLWIGSEDKGLDRLREGKVTHFSAKDGPLNDVILSLYGDTGGSLWIGTRGGLFRMGQAGKIAAFTTREGLASNVVSTIFEDREGSLWLGTSYGINRFKDAKVTTLGPADGLPNEFIWSVYEDRQGTLWIGTHGSGLVKLTNGVVKAYSTEDGLPNAVVRAFLEDRSGDFWIGTLGGLGRLSRGKFTTYTTRDGLTSNIIRSIYQDNRGDIWIGTSDGLNRLEGGVVKPYPLEGAPRPTTIYFIFEDPSGGLWLGTRNGIIIITNGRCQKFGAKEGFTDDAVYCIFRDNGGMMYFGTTRGLRCWKNNRLTSFTTRDGLPNNTVYRIMTDPQQRLWMSSNKGIFCLTVQEIDAFTDGRISRLSPQVFGRADGMPTMECNGGSQSAGCVTRDGKLWFPTLRGLVQVDPSHLKSNKVIPPVKIEEVIVDTQNINPGATAELPAGSEKLEFHYAALSYLAPEKVRFKYKLENFDSDWVDAGNRRVAYYTNLSPKDYRFRVIACNNDDVWNEQGAVFDFTLRPFFYQTKSFYAAIVLVVFLAGVGVNRIRYAKLKARERELSHLVAERTKQLADTNHQLEQANKELERLANLDGLTGVFNHRYFMDVLAVEWKRAERSALALSLIMIDVDHFKAYNDHYGHQAGDQCLKTIGTMLKDTATRAGDIVGRYGGEEFIILLPATKLDGAIAVAERIQEKMEALGLQHEFSPVGNHVTISLGIAATTPHKPQEPAQLIAAADRLLYAAKEEGRNRIKARPLE